MSVKFNIFIIYANKRYNEHDLLDSIWLYKIKGSHNQSIDFSLLHRIHQCKRAQNNRFRTEICPINIIKSKLDRKTRPPKTEQ